METEEKMNHLEPAEVPITFLWEDRLYACPQSAFERNRILLPDGRILAATSWFESLPPKPGGLHVIEAYPQAREIMPSSALDASQADNHEGFHKKSNCPLFLQGEIEGEPNDEMMEEFFKRKEL